LARLWTETGSGLELNSLVLHIFRQHTTCALGGTCEIQHYSGNLSNFCLIEFRHCRFLMTKFLLSEFRFTLRKILPSHLIAVERTFLFYLSSSFVSLYKIMDNVDMGGPDSNFQGGQLDFLSSSSAIFHIV
jgi:hypothetical protein